MKDTNINTQVIWDNLRIDVNNNLFKLENHTLSRRFNAFTKPPYYEIQSILEKLGKALYWACAAYSLNETDLQIKDYEQFGFYFWPGYDTLNGHRVFINGIDIEGRKSQQKYFTGIGGKTAKIKNTDKFLDFIRGKGFNPNNSVPRDKEEMDSFSKEENDNLKLFLSFEGDNFYQKDNPSTVAFDNILNHLSFKDSVDLNDFMPGSTHYWKTNQTVSRLIGDNRRTERFMSIRLQDKSEIRILQVSLVNDGVIETFGGNGILTIKIPNEQNRQVGLIISKELSLDNLINKGLLYFFNDEHKQAFIQKYLRWPRGNKNLSNESKDDPFLDQINGYTYWLLESMTEAKDYDFLKDLICFNKSGQPRKYASLAKRVITFNSFLKDNPHAGEFYKVRYNHWYTQFYEGYSPSSDLGSSMFFSCKDLSKTNFLKDAMNNIRWLYQDLRQIEIKTLREYERNIKDIRVLKHSQRQYINSSKHLLDKLNKGNLDKYIPVLKLNNEIIDGYLDIAEFLDKPKDYVNSSSNFENVNLNKIIIAQLSVFATILEDEEATLRSFKHKNILNIKDYLLLRLEELIQNLNIQVLFIHSSKNILSLIIKELLINAIENMSHQKPLLNITTYCKDKYVYFEIANSVMKNKIKSGKTIFENISRGNALDGRLGWRVIFSFKKAMNLTYQVSTYQEVLDTHRFKFVMMFKTQG